MERHTSGFERLGGRLIGIAAVAAATLLPAQVLADVIDGDWCYSDGRHFQIRGPDIVTPAGTSTRGAWSRHSFSYVATAAEPSAGATIYMLLANENTVLLAVGVQPSGSGAQTQIWKRCAPAVSELSRPTDADSGRRGSC